jgi:hypothetical protein
VQPGEPARGGSVVSLWPDRDRASREEGSRGSPLGLQVLLDACMYGLCQVSMKIGRKSLQGV